MTRCSSVDSRLPQWRRWQVNSCRMTLHSELSSLLLLSSKAIPPATPSQVVPPVSFSSHRFAVGIPVQCTYTHSLIAQLFDENREQLNRVRRRSFRISDFRIAFCLWERPTHAWWYYRREVLPFSAQLWFKVNDVQVVRSKYVIYLQRQFPEYEIIIYARSSLPSLLRSRYAQMFFRVSVFSFPVSYSSKINSNIVLIDIIPGKLIR